MAADWQVRIEPVRKFGSLVILRLGHRLARAEGIEHSKYPRFPDRLKEKLPLIGMKVKMPPKASDKGEGFARVRPPAIFVVGFHELEDFRMKGVGMGQAAVDLPDPLQAPSAGKTNDADDLLSQLAGDEIDRLLSSSETASPPPPVAETPPEPLSAVEEIQKDLDNLCKELTVSAPAPAAEPALPEASVECVVAPGVENPAPIADASAPVVDSPVPVTTAPVADAPAPAPAPESKPEATESAEATVGQVLDAALSSQGEGDAPGFIVRLLEFVNSPFAMVPDDLRQSLGKIAIVTTINASAILLYVILFRKH